MASFLDTNNTHNNAPIPFPMSGVTIKCFQTIRDYVASVDPNWTTTDVCNHLIKPLTKDSQSSFEHYIQTHHSHHHDPQDTADPFVADFQKAVFDLKHTDCFNDDTPPHCFISHAWSYKFCELVNALESFLQDYICKNPLNNTTENTYFWFDLFVNNQWKAPVLPFEWWCGAFKTAVGEIGHTVLVLLPWNAPVPLTRAWCLWEILCTRATNSTLTIQLSDHQRDAFESMLRTDYTGIMKTFCKIDVKNSQAWNPLDKERIMSAVEVSEGGIAGVNNQVTSLLREWMKQTAITVLLRDNHGVSTKDAEAFYLLALVYQSHGDFIQAEELLQRSLDLTIQLLGPDHDDVLVVMSAMALLKNDTGKFESAEGIYREIIQQRQKTLGAEAPKTLQTMANLAMVVQKRGQYDEAVTLNREIIAIQQTSLGAQHIDSLVTMHNLANILQTQRKWPEAESLYQTVIHAREEILGHEHPSTLGTMMSLANLFSYASRFEEACPLYEAVIYGYEKTLGAKHMDTLAVMNNYGMMLFNQSVKNNNNEESIRNKAIEYVQRASDGWIEQLHPEHALVCTSYANLANLHIDRNLEEAERLSRLALTGRESSLGYNHANTADSLNQLAEIMHRKGNMDESIQLSKRALSIFETTLGKEHVNYLNECLRLANKLQLLGYFDTVGELMDAALDGYQKLIDARQFLMFKRTLMNARAEFDLDTAISQLEIVQAHLQSLPSSNESDPDVQTVKEDITKLKQSQQLSQDAERMKESFAEIATLFSHHEEHSLQLISAKAKQPGGGFQSYICDICKGIGHGMVYVCLQCDHFDVHPQCVQLK